MVRHEVSGQIRSPVKDLVKIVGYLVGTAVLGATVAPWLFWGGRWLAAHGGPAFLGELDFQRCFHRGFLVAALALLWPAVRWLRIGSVAALGLEPNPHWRRDLLVGTLLPVLLLWLYGAGLLHLDFYRLKDPLPWARLPPAFATAAAVAVIEECLFRGVILGLVARTAPAPAAVVSVSALFSILHFLKPREGILTAEEIGPWSGFALLPHAFHQFAEPGLVLAGFTTLFVVGVILAVATRGTRSLWFAIGLHAGLILGTRTFSILARRRAVRPPWIGDDLKIGLVPLLVLLILLAVVVAYVRRRSPVSSRLARGG